VHKRRSRQRAHAARTGDPTMRRFTLAIFVLTAASLCAQGVGTAATSAPSSANGNAAQANTQPLAPAAPAQSSTAQQPANGVVYVPMNNGIVNTGGYATSAPISAPLIATPSFSLNVAAANSAGATSGTSNMMVGASNAGATGNLAAAGKQSEPYGGQHYGGNPGRGREPECEQRSAADEHGRDG